MQTSSCGKVTLLLRQLRAGDRSKLEPLLEAVHPDLRRMAQRRFRHEGPGHLLQPTALVNEAYLRLVAREDQTWENRAHFLAAAARAMRRILIDHARGLQSVKRGGGDIVPLEDVDVPDPGRPVDFLALDDALTRLQQISPRQARIVELRYFAGMSVPEVAQVIGRDPRTVDRDWAAARAWLRSRLCP